MLREEELFQGKSWREEGLLSFGFVKEKESYIYSKEILDGQFDVVVTISKDQTVQVRVMDKDLEEEYTAFRAVRATGAFVGQVRQEVEEVLTQIEQACFVSVGLGSSQGQWLVEQLAQKFGDQGSQPFEKFPGIHAFRHPVNDKWYALALKLERGKLDLAGEDWSQEQRDEEIEVLNIKVPPAQLEELLEKKGVYPSYHMNKKHWISLTLDGSVPRDMLFDLVVQSRSLVGGKVVPQRGAPHCWVIPANPKVFDIDREFAQTDEVYWTQKSSIQAGDLVCMYVTAPVQVVRYVCLVLEDHIPPEQVPEEASGKPLMKVRRVHTFEDTAFPRERMRELGVRAVRGPRRLTPEMAAAVKEALGNSSAIVQKEIYVQK